MHFQLAYVFLNRSRPRLRAKSGKESRRKTKEKKEGRDLFFLLDKDAFPPHFFSAHSHVGFHAGDRDDGEEGTLTAGTSC